MNEFQYPEKIQNNTNEIPFMYYLEGEKEKIGENNEVRNNKLWLAEWKKNKKRFSLLKFMYNLSRPFVLLDAAYSRINFGYDSIETITDATRRNKN